MWKENFRVQLFDTDAAGANVINVGYDPGGITVGLNKAKVIDSLSKALSIASALNRRFVAVGVDSRAEIWGKPVDDGVNTEATPIRALTAGEQAEQMYCRLDTVPPGLTVRIHLANQPQVSGTGGLDTDVTAETEPA